MKKLTEKNVQKKIYAKNVLFLVSIAPETVSELRMHFPVALNSLTFDKKE